MGPKPLARAAAEVSDPRLLAMVAAQVSAHQLRDKVATRANSSLAVVEGTRLAAGVLEVQLAAAVVAVLSVVAAC